MRTLKMAENTQPVALMITERQLKRGEGPKRAVVPLLAPQQKLQNTSHCQCYDTKQYNTIPKRKKDM